MKPLIFVAMTMLLSACCCTGRPAAPCPCGERCACTACVCEAEPVPSGTVQLFNGRDLDGWRAVYVDGSTDISKAWSVNDGILQCAGQPIGYIQTTRNWESYKLVIEWRFNPEKGAGNSGVLMRITGPDKVWPRSIEAQLHSGNAGDIWNIGGFPMRADDERTHGRRTAKADDSNEKPLGQWNRYEITLDGGDLSLIVNGREQNVATDCQVIPGGIGLQSEGAWIEFRRVELRPLP